MKTAIATFAVSCCLFSSLYAQEKNPLIKSGEVFVKAYEYMGEKKYDEAITEFHKIPVNDTNYVIAMIELASVYSVSGKDSLTILLCDAMIKERTPYTSQFYIAKGNAYDNLKKTDLALKAYDEAEKLYPTDYLIDFNRGVMLFQAEKYAESEKYFQKALKINPYHTSSLVRLAQVNMKFGRIVPAMMCLQFYLLIDNSSDRAKQVAVTLEELVKGELEDGVTARLPYGDQDDFTELDELIKSKIALQDKYKSKTKLKFALAKQVEAFLTKVKYSKGNAGFYMDFFAKFFEELNKNGYSETFIYAMLSGLKIEEVDKWMRSNDAKFKKFIEWGIPYVQQNLATYETDLNGKREKATHYFSDGVLKAVGNKDAAGKNIGYWKFYHNMYTLQSEGNYVNDMKDGVWKFYHKNGNLKEESVYSKGMYDGEMKEFHELGTPSVKANYDDNIPQGMAYLYDIAGNRVNEFNLDKGIKNGKQKTYYSSGGQESEVGFVNGKGEGAYVQYYESGNIKEEGSFTADLKNGPTTSYYDAPGKILEFKGGYKNNEPVGDWKYFNENGKVSSEGVFDERGKKNGKWKSYHTNGKLMAEYEYAKGEIDGAYNLYDTTGTQYASYVYKAGQLKEYSFTINGKVIDKSKESGRELVFNEYYFNGNIKKKGKYVSGKEEGKWEEYNFNGNKTSEYSYKNGVMQGDYIEYHPSGATKVTVPYVDGKPDGYSKRYYSNGKLEEEGWFVAGQRQGNWPVYWIDGTIKSRYYYLNDEFYGWQQYYAVNGKLSHEEKYDYSQFVAIKYFDTTGVELQRHYLDKGTGTISGLNAIGKVRSTITYQGGNAQGVFEWTYPNGKVDTKGPYHCDKRNGAFEEYYPNGNKRAEFTYRFGKLNGTYKLYHENGKLMEDNTYRNGDKEGMCKTYHENGQIYREDFYEDGLTTFTKIFDETGQMIVHRKYYRDFLTSCKTYDAAQKPVELAIKNETGKVQGYYPNKIKSIECEYKNGILVGKRNTWHSNGKPYQEENFVNGEEEGPSKVYYPSGSIKQESNYLTGQYHGQLTTYHPNGKVKSREVYRLGNLHGVCKYYNDKGELTFTRTYYNDQLIEEK